MKRYFYRFVVFAATVLACGACSLSDDEPLSQSGQLTITLDSGFLQTRAADVSFEGVIDHFDFFFFTDAEGTTPVQGMHGRVSGSTTTLDATKSGDFYALRHITSYVYILANYPGTIDHTSDYTLAQLLALELDHPLASHVTAVNPDTGDSEETDEIAFCDYLVMDSYDAANDTYTTELTPETFNETRTVTIGLSRIAAKLTLEITVPASVAGMGEEVWTPLVKDIQAYYVNALNNKPTVDAAPVRRSALDSETGYDYMTYPTSYPLTRKEGDAIVFDTDPVYTYPQEWTMGENGEAYFKIAMPWNGSIHGTSNFYYKVTAPKQVDGVITLNRNSWYKVSVTLSVLDSEEEYIEIEGGFTVEPWYNGIDGGTNLSSARFFNVPVRQYEIYSQNSVDVPFSSSSAVSAYFTEISYTHYQDGAGTTYTFSYTADDNLSSVTLPTTYGGENITPAIARDRNEYTLTVEGNQVKFTHALSDIYTVRSVTFVIKNSDPEAEASAIITVMQHPSIEVKSRLGGTVFVNGHFARAKESVHVNGDATKKMGIGYELQYEPGQGETRYHSDDTDFNRTATSATDETDNLTYWYQPGAGYAGGEQTSPLVIRNVAYGRYGFIEGDVNRGHELYMVEVNVSAFDENNNTYKIKEGSQLSDPKNFILGDPRVEAGDRFSILKTAPDRKINGESSNYRRGGGYLYQSSTVRNSDGTTTVGDAVYKGWTQPEKILIGSTDALDGSFIAPQFMVSSFFNAQPGALTHEECLKRAATYQEAGFPAGRWRLPTEAEIVFMVQQQQRGVLPYVWAPGSSYWCADGRYVTIASSGDVVTFYTASSDAKHVNRFVYDLWYWGSEPMEDTETFWADMHLAAPNANAGN
ncbi:MAG: hypothetical protein K6F98_04575 [Bacteroidales bacterium]|nr:hypothetical protein [Bacteroidales bacterium]